MGREIDAEPRVLIVSQPTWGVDVGAAAEIRGELLRLRDAGAAVLVVSEELDELFEITDRLVVMARRRMSPDVMTREATVEQIGTWMSGLWPGSASRDGSPSSEHVECLGWRRDRSPRASWRSCRRSWRSLSRFSWAWVGFGWDSDMSKYAPGRTSLQP